MADDTGKHEETECPGTTGITASWREQIEEATSILQHVTAGEAGPGDWESLAELLQNATHIKVLQV